MNWLTAIRINLVLTVLLGIIYPLIMAGLAHALFPAQAAGSLVTRDGQVIGSKIIGQNFAAARYFRPRPSDAGKGYDASSSGGSNLGPTNKALIETVRANLDAVLKENPGIKASQVPIDMVTASGSGLDYEISPADADLQAARVAEVRGMPIAAVQRLIVQNTRGRWAGVLGERGVNVLELNLALDRARGAGRRANANPGRKHAGRTGLAGSPILYDELSAP